MTPCDSERIEAYLDDALGPAARAEMGAHLEQCSACSRELAWLRAERQLFTARAAVEPVPLPSFDAVLAGSRAPRPHRALRRRPAWLLASLGAAAAVALLVHPQSPARTVEASGGACFLSDGFSSPSIELAAATEESSYRACLIASPAPVTACN